MRVPAKPLSSYPFYLQPFFSNQRRKYGEVLQAALRERPDNEELSVKLKELQDMPGEPVEAEAKSGMGRVIVVLAVIVVVMYIFYSFVL